jgi:hypothetical protein
MRALLTPVVGLMMMTIAASAQNATVRVLFFTGNVTVHGAKAAIGMQLGARDEVAVPAGATLQLSINGKVIKYSQPAKIRVADAIKRAGSGENVAVANTVRTLAAATGADRSARTSKAGATRATDTSRLLAQGKKQAATEMRNAANDELAARTGIDDPLGKAGEIAKRITGDDDMIILEPRATAVTSEPLRFRWLHSPSAGGYVVSVKNYLGEEIFRRETSDTTVTWDDAKLAPEVIYSWTLTDSKNSMHGSGALFHRVSDSLDATIRTGVAAITKELGGDNPALPVVLGGFYADNECYGESARLFTEGALNTRQHYDELMRRACDQYQYQMSMREEEVGMVYQGSR